MDERRAKRVVVDLKLDAQVEGAIVRVHVYDLSMDGCSIEAESTDFPSSGASVTLRFLSDVEVKGTLAWVRSRNGGVHFKEPLPGPLVHQLGFADSATGQKGFQDQFGRSHSVPGQRFDVARDRSSGAQRSPVAITPER